MGKKCVLPAFVALLLVSSLTLFVAVKLNFVKSSRGSEENAAKQVKFQDDSTFSKFLDGDQNSAATTVSHTIVVSSDLQSKTLMVRPLNTLNVSSEDKQPFKISFKCLPENVWVRFIKKGESFVFSEMNERSLSTYEEVFNTIKAGDIFSYGCGDGECKVAVNPCVIRKIQEQ